ncbi:MAG: hypothetical protein R2717_02535 [Schumannella sp.]
MPGWISDEQVVTYLGPAHRARSLSACPFVRGDEVRVESTDPVVREITSAWARSLGARVVDDGGSYA